MADDHFVIYTYETRRAAYRVSADDAEHALRAYVEMGSGEFLDSIDYVSERMGEPVKDGSAHADIDAAPGPIQRRHDASEDMLAALKEIMAVVDNSTPVEWRDQPRWNAARAAIAKAEGRSNG